MITFKQFFIESQWMYHGTTAANVDVIKRNEKSSDTDRAVGGHFSADPEIAKKFSSGFRSQSLKTGTVYKTKRPSRSELEKVPQKPNHDDQTSVESHVLSTVFSHPDNKHLFTKWHNQKFGSTRSESDNVYNKLSKGEHIPSNQKEYNYDKSNTNTFRSYVAHHGAYHGSGMGHKKLHSEIVDKFIDHMKSKGKKGLVYHNTDTDEVSGVDSKKCYIIFEPHKLKIQKHED